MEATFPTPHWPFPYGSLRLSLTPSPAGMTGMPDYFHMVLQAPSVPLSGDLRLSLPFKAPVLLCFRLQNSTYKYGQKNTPPKRRGVIKYLLGYWTAATWPPSPRPRQDKAHCREQC